MNHILTRWIQYIFFLWIFMISTNSIPLTNKGIQFKELILKEDKLYRCTVCNKTMPHRSNMKKHLETHLSGLSYEIILQNIVDLIYVRHPKAAQNKNEATPSWIIDYFSSIITKDSTQFFESLLTIPTLSNAFCGDILSPRMQIWWSGDTIWVPGAQILHPGAPNLASRSPKSGLPDTKIRVSRLFLRRQLLKCRLAHPMSS